MKTQTMFFLLLAGLLSACGSSDSEKGPSGPKPNILFLFADDYTYEAVRALGNQVIETPNLDRLVNTGASFTHAYNMGGWHGAVCVASRSMIVSGTSLWKAEQIARRWAQKDTAALNQTWGKWMEAQGYHTYISGKWHVAAPPEYVFQTVRHIRPGMPGDYWGKTPGLGKKIREAYQQGEVLQSVMPLGYHRPMDENDHSWLASDTTHGGFWQGGKHWSEVLKDDALDFIADAAQKDDPFFMYLAFNAPHDPRQAPQSFLDKYPVEAIPLPENWLPEYPFKDQIGNSPLLRDEALAPFPRTPFAIKTHLREYYAIITHLDEQIGKILDALEASGKMDNTYIFFTGDHGLSVGHHGLLGKQSLFDHSIRVPLMVAGPGIPPGKKVEADVYLQDIMATTLEVAGIEKPDFLDFHSFLGLARGETTKGHYEQGVYGAYTDLQRMIRKDGYKLLVFPKMEKVLLFDLEKDPLEMNDLAARPEQAEKIKVLFSDLLELQKEMQDTLDLKPIYQALQL